MIIKEASDANIRNVCIIRTLTMGMIEQGTLMDLFSANEAILEKTFP